MNNDDISVVSSNYMSTLRTKNIIETPDSYDKLPRIVSVPETMRMDFSRILNKPFLLGTVPWTAATVSNTEFFRISFPDVLYDSYLTSVPFNSSCLGRYKMCVMLQVSGTPMHSGCVIAATTPYYSPKVVDVNSILPCPHVFLMANEATSVCLEVPFYNNTTLIRSKIDSNTPTYSNSGKVCDLVLYVLNALTSSAGSSTNLTVSVHMMFKEADFYVPRNGETLWQAEGWKDELYRIPTQVFDSLANGTKKVVGDVVDIARQAVRGYTGFHSFTQPVLKDRMLVTFKNNIPNSDAPYYLPIMDNHSLFNRIYDDFYFLTDQDEMSVKHIVQKPVYQGTFIVNSNDITGKALSSFPITPFVEINATNSVLTYCSPMRTLYENSRYWKGGLKLHIQSVMTNFHFCKLLVVKNYSPDINYFTDVPLYKDVHNLPTDTLEFSSGGQIQTVCLPYCAMTNQLECTKCPIANILSHGMVTIYLVQPLVYNSNVPLNVSFNCYITADDDFEFMGYDTDLSILLSGSVPSYGTFAAQGLPEVDPSDQSPLLNQNTKAGRDDRGQLFPNESIRDYLRAFKPIFCRELTPSGDNGTLTFPVNHYATAASTYTSSFGSLRTLFYGLSGGLRFKIKITGASEASLYYVPPSTAGDLTNSFIESAITPAIAPAVVALVADNYKFAPTIMPFPLPQIEMPDYVRPLGSTTSMTSSSSNVFELECEIPNISHLNFLGDSRNSYYGLPTSTPLTDMGSITLCYLSSLIGAVYRPIQIQVYIALADEARLGFQTYAPRKIVASAAGYRLSPYGTVPSGTNVGGIVVGITDVQASYYFKSS